MGNAESEPESPHPSLTQIGYRLMSIQPSSPASLCSLTTYFDFVIAAGVTNSERRVDFRNGEDPEEIATSFARLVQEAAGSASDVTMIVFNTKMQKSRKVTLTPNNTWGGIGLLGVTIRLDTYYAALSCILRILTVPTNSPGAIAGLVQGTDYLLGSDTTAFDSAVTLESVLTNAKPNPIRLYVYSSETDIVRSVTLMPGDTTLLGCEVGEGYLHGIPAKCRDSYGTSEFRSEVAVRREAEPVVQEPVVQSSSVESWESSVGAVRSFEEDEVTVPAVAVDREEEERRRMENWEKGQRDRQGEEEAPVEAPTSPVVASAADLFPASSPSDVGSATFPPPIAPTPPTPSPPSPTPPTPSPTRITAATSTTTIPVDPTFAFLPPPPLSHVDSPQLTK